MKTTFVSVIMPVFNRANYVRDAIDSILEQTLRNLELIVIDDGSTDGSLEILEDYAARDGRIRLIRNETNQGVATCLNLGVNSAVGEYIARMDSDDISLCTRLEKQIRFLEDNLDVAACGTWVKLFGELQGIVWELPTDHDTIRSTMLFCGAIAHPAAVIRRTVFSDLCYRFDADYNGAEDYDLWTRLAERRKLANVPEILFLYRIHPENLSKNATTPSQQERVRRIRHRQLAALGISPNEQESRTHQIVSEEQPTTGREDLEHINQWCEKLIAANRHSGFFPLPAFSNVVRKKQDAAVRLNKTEGSFLSKALTRATVPMEFASDLAKQILPGRTTNWVRKRKRAAWRWGRRGLESIEGTRESFQTRMKLGIKLEDRVPKPPRIGMAVLAHERPDYLAVCLDSLFRTNLYDYDITFLIHDDGSTDPRVREIIEREYDPNYKITRYFGPKGPNCAGAAINRALKKLLAMDSYDIIGWCDPDALFHPEWLDRTMKIALWAKEHHGDHILGPFSSFHSSDVDFHGNLGTYASPYGNYVVKRQMGMLNYFYFTNDFRKLGFFVESPDDETLMTEKFARLRVRNFCTETSYVEHIGHRSVLNTWRPVPLKRAVHGLNLAPGPWEGDLEKWSPYAYYKFLKPNRGMARDNNVKSELALDVVIPLHAKDLEIAPLTIASVNKYLRHPVNRMFVVAQPQKSLLDFCKEHNCMFVDENEVLPIRREDVRRAMARLGIFNRTEWLVQQLIKLECNSFCSEDYVYAIDADTFLVRPQKFEHDGKVILLVSDEYHPPYYETYAGILHDAIEPRFSLVTHQMVFQRKRLEELKGDIEDRNGAKPWYEAILENLVPAENAAFSEFETYGNWMKARYPDSISFEYWFNVALRRGKRRKLEYYTLKYGQNYRSVSFQHYDAV